MQKLSIAIILLALAVGLGLVGTDAEAVPSDVAPPNATARLTNPPAPAPGAFKKDQLRYSRVRDAEARRREAVVDAFLNVGLTYPPKEIYLRSLKQDYKLELWARGSNQGRFTKVKSFDVCALSGDLGPKRRQGDGQVPEGFYTVDRFNPASNFLLSLGLNYPNDSDRVLGTSGRLGGDIFIHGGCATIGCIPIGDTAIRELYLVAIDSRDGGQRHIPVHIFPTAMTDSALTQLKADHPSEPALLSHWENIKAGWDLFESTNIPPKVSVAADGSYRFSAGK